MARKATGRNAQTNGAGGEGENISAYFRGVFERHPHLLDSRSNDEILQHWRDDHPGEREIPKRVKTGLMNIKSVLRSKRRRRGRPKKSAAGAVASDQARISPRSLGQLEEHIDESLWMARNIDLEGLADIIQLLRKARNEVVWKMGS
jgi:hypothetical protein